MLINRQDINETNVLLSHHPHHIKNVENICKAIRKEGVGVKIFRHGRHSIYTYGDGRSVLARSAAQDGHDVLGEESVGLGQPNQ